MRKILLIIPLFMALLACTPEPPYPTLGYVDLSDRQPLPTPDSEIVPLRVAVAAVISPKGTIESYRGVLDYLSQELDRPVELIQRRTYMEVNDLIERGEVDLAFVCTSAYLVGHHKFDMELLVAPQVEGDTVYYSVLIVPASSTTRSIQDLRDKVFAFTDPISLTGRMYPTWLVENEGHTPEEYFSSIFFTYSHDDAIEAVANGLADGAAVDSLIYDFAVARDPSLAERTRIIHRSPAFGIPPVVVAPTVRPQIKMELQTLLLGMDESPLGQAALEAIGVEQFVVVEDGIYQGVRTMLGSAYQIP